MAIGDTFDRFQELLPEALEASVETLQVADDEEGMDPISEFISSTRQVQKMGRDDAGGPGYLAKWRVRTQRGGLMEGGSFGKGALHQMGPGDSLTMGNAANVLSIDPTHTPRRSYLSLQSRLRKAMGNYVIDHDDMEADLVSEPLEDLVVGAVEDLTILHRKLTSAMHWGAGNGVMGAFTASASITSAAISWVSIADGQIYRFVRGQRYVPAAAALGAGSQKAGTAADPATLRCVGINPRTLKVGFQAEGTTIAVVATDVLVYRGMYDFVNGTSLAPNGIENLLIKTGTFPDTTHDVANWPELQAFIEGETLAEANYRAPEQEVLDRLLNRMVAADRMLTPVLFAELEIWSLWAHLDRRANSIVNVPQGVTYVAAGGVSGPLVTYGGRPFVKMESTMCRPNTIYGLHAPSFKRFGPNDKIMHWRIANGGAAGVPGIFRVVLGGGGGQLTNLYSADFEVYHQLAVSRPTKNFIERGIHSQTTFNSYSIA